MDCGAERWAECVAKLDRARDLDPAGDTTSYVTQLRDAAEAAQTPVHVEDPLEDKQIPLEAPKRAPE